MDASPARSIRPCFAKKLRIQMRSRVRALRPVQFPGLTSYHKAGNGCRYKQREELNHVERKQKHEGPGRSGQSPQRPGRDLGAKHRKGDVLRCQLSTRLQDLGRKLEEQSQLRSR